MRVVIVATGGAIALGALALYRRHCAQRAPSASLNALTACRAAEGQAHVYTLASVDRKDMPGGTKGGMPGMPASHYLTTEGTPEVVDAADLFATGTDYVLYAVEDVASEQPFLVFLSLTPTQRTKLFLEVPFIDRGIRKLVTVGARVAVVSLASVEAVLCGPHAPAELAPSACGLSFVWNTGRCGSTLLHKALSAFGVISLSEPHWLDTLSFHHRATDAATLRRALRVCVGCEVRLARAQTQIDGWSTATSFSFNPKAGGTSHLAPAVAEAFPHAKHVFMYRACHKVVESFMGLHAQATKGSGSLPGRVLERFAARLKWRLAGTRAVTPPPSAPISAHLGQLSSLAIASGTSRWIGIVCQWVELIEARRRAPGASSDALAQAANLRMDEFASRDLSARTAVLRATLSHLGVVDADADEETLAPALSAFGTHSQAGSMMAGPKAKIMVDADVPSIKRAVAAGLEHLATDGVVVQEAGGNVVLPRSIGT